MAFGYYRSLTVQSSQVPSTQTDFPVLVSVTHADLKSTGNGGHVQSSSGFDIRPYSDSALTTALTFELEFYDPVNGILVMWVKIASLSDGLVFYLAYGDAGLTTDGSNSATWSNSFASVFNGSISAQSQTPAFSISSSQNADSSASSTTARLFITCFLSFWSTH